MLKVNVVHAASASVSFDLGFSYVRTTFSAAINVQDGSVEPGKSTTVEVSAIADTATISLVVPNLGTASVQIDPLGENSYPIPGLYYDYLLVKLGVTLTTKGVIEGQLGVVGKGSVDKSSLEWGTSGTQNFYLNATPEATQGESIGVSLDQIMYTLNIGVKAEGEVLGNHKEISLIDYQRLGSIPGTPSTVSGTYNVRVGQTNTSVPAPSLQGSSLLLLAAVIFALVAIPIVILAAVFSSPKVKTSKTRSDEQKLSGTPSLPPPRVTYIRMRPSFAMKSCPTCHHLATYVPQQSRWYCSRCKKQVD
jgi:hypothetical protein